MRPWQFGKPKTPGFGISRDFYLSVLCSASILPSIRDVVNPDGDGGAAVGFGAPLNAAAADKGLLRQPMERGAYAVVSKDKKTVLQLLVVSRDEAGYDPEAFAQSSMALGADPELLARIRGTWNLAQLRYESHDPMVYSALDFLLGVSARLAQLGDGVVADPISRRYMLPQGVFHPGRTDPRIDARDHVSVNFRVRKDGLHAYTLGLQKFNLPEHEILNLLDSDQRLAAAFLTGVAQKILQGDLTRSGDLFGSPSMFFQAREGGFDRALWENMPVFELLPPTAHTATEALQAWAKETGIA